MHFSEKNGMLRKINKDINLRKKSYYSELRLKFLKTIIYDFTLDSKKKLYVGCVIARELQSSFTQVKNRCILTGRSRGLYSFFKMSRIRLKENVLMGRLFGVFKLSK